MRFLLPSGTNPGAPMTDSFPSPFWPYAWSGLLSAYLLAGAGFALWFALRGNRRVLPALDGAGIGLRLLMVPASILLWPVLLRQALSPPTGGHRPPGPRLRHRARASWWALAVLLPALFVVAIRGFGERPQIPDLERRLGILTDTPQEGTPVASWEGGGLWRTDSGYRLRVTLPVLTAPDPRWIVDGRDLGPYRGRGVHAASLPSRPRHWCVVDAIRGDTLLRGALPGPADPAAPFSEPSVQP